MRELALADQPFRAAVVVELASSLSDTVALGDDMAAQIVHEAIGRLFGPLVAPEGRVRLGRQSIPRLASSR